MVEPPTTLTPPLERTEQSPAARPAAPETWTAVEEVPNATTQGCAVATGNSSDQEAEETVMLEPLVKSFAKASGTDRWMVTSNAASRAERMPDTFRTVIRS